MRWKRGAGSGNVEDRRGRPGGRAALPGRRRHRRDHRRAGDRAARRRGGYDVGSPFEQFPAQQQPGEDSAAMQNAPSAQSELVDFVPFVVGDLESFWAGRLQQGGPRVRARAGSCSSARRVDDRRAAPRSSQTGPFYCPADQQIYVDLGFFRDARRPLQRPRRLRAGVRARARVRPPRPDDHAASRSRSTAATRENPDQRNELSVRVELQADCLAGVWAHSTYERGLLERGRPRGGPDRRRRGRRRPHPGRGDGADQPRDVHARHRGAARELVQARLRGRRRDRLRHLLRRHLSPRRNQSVKRLAVGRRGRLASMR